MIIGKKYFAAILCFITSCMLYTVNAQSKKEVKTLLDYEIKLQDNKTVNFSELKGKVVLLDFWYRGCAPCIEAIPTLIKIQEEFKNDLVIIGINDMDIQEDVVNFFKYKKTNYPSTYKTDGKIIKNLDIKIQLYPTTLLYDRQGNLIKMDYGYNKSKMNSLHKAVKKAVKDK